MDDARDDRREDEVREEDSRSAGGCEPDAGLTDLPETFRRWFAGRGWAPRAHQLELLARAREGRSSLLIAPTGAGKTLAGFLPSLVELAERSRARNSARPPGVHTLYISPLKALAVDVARNLERPAEEMGLPIRIETRTGDTPASRRQRQRRDPPDILLTTPEQIALLIASADAAHLFGDLRRIVLDELHALAGSKRGDLLSLGIARLRRIAPEAQTVGLSATVADPDTLRRWLVPQVMGGEMGDVVVAEPGAAPDLSMLESVAHVPWAGHTARHSLAEIYALIERNTTTLVFVNTRMQAELLFQELWRINEANLPIALHHGSLDVSQRRRVEAAMGEGRLRAVVCTSSLDLGIDWGAVDLVVNVGAPKGSSRLMQRIGRANHRLDEPSRAVLVPANRFEVLECRAALEAVRAGAQDGAVERRGALDVLAQHVLGMACAEAFDAEQLYEEVRSAEPYAGLTREDFEDVVDFVATGGYALRAYERYARIRRRKDGLWRVANPMVAQQYRLNVGTIVESTMLKVRLAGAKSRFGGRVLGEVEEYFVETMSPGDTFVFAGEVLEYITIVEDEVRVARSNAAEPKVPSYAGGKFPLSTFLAARVRALLAAPEGWSSLPAQVHEWLEIQRRRSRLPGREDLLVETFPRGGRHYLVAYPFEGRLAHQTLGMLLTRRLDRLGLHPLGFMVNDYALAIYGVRDLSLAIAQARLDLDRLFDADMLGDDLEDWLAESALMKRTFRQCAVIGGLIERRFPGKEKNSRQVTMSTDLVYDVLRRHEPDHVLLRAARADAATGLLDIRRLSDMLVRIRGRIDHVPLARVSPLAVPVMLEIGREMVAGGASEALLAEAEDELIREALDGAGDGGG
ncbi:ligase-associated DNA damage response DEXH box helicase [Ancylobacter sp. MQZ15Z-1]|uniref:Ligase-associated DNA damage response DEXH box helicase n=1 Tax=Ancylobacter mangrovi TaxID=2972472 RepID=A0A9X2PFZ0_9HYPH|nr:ligase-associated DNA damage response DEXH box helicase [Ancylobacter mangrovi]MCS0495468.1 ligase-associated DNA damage response DEXH box helicase [Ancylobacter mangrovi]